MPVNIYLEERFILCNGIYYSLLYDEDFWDRYLNVFDKVYVVARVKEVKDINSIKNSYKRVDNRAIIFLNLPYYHGLLEAFYSIPVVLFYMLSIVASSNNNILRLPGMISIVAGLFCIFFRKSFGVELVGDPYEVFSTGIGGRFSKILRSIFTFLTKFLVRKAKGVAYVTRYTMQARYIAASNVFTTYYSSIMLPRNLIVQRRIISKFSNDIDFNILLVGSIEQRYKGFDLVLVAISQIKEIFPSIKVSIIGDGIYKKELIELAISLGIEDRIYFLGKISRSAVLDIMDNADLFIMPSRTEGLPRALIEAMARGLPAIGSNVGGIPELLSSEFLFEKENISELAELLARVIPDYSLRLEMSQLNLKTAQEYRSDLLEIRRNSFYSYLASEQ